MWLCSLFLATGWGVFLDAFVAHGLARFGGMGRSKTKWKILDVFPAKTDYANKDITVVKVYPLNDNYCGDAFDLFLELEALEFWKNHIGESFEISEDLDLTKLSSAELRETLKEKVNFT